MEWIYDITYPHLPDMTLRGVDKNGTDRVLKIESGALIGDPSVLIPLQLFISGGGEVRLAPDRDYMPAGFDDPFQAYLTLRHCFQRISREDVPEDIFPEA